MYFCLSKNVYAGRYEDDIIILDGPRDNYFSITDAPAQHLPIVLTEEFKLVDGSYIPLQKDSKTYDQEVISGLIQHFTEQGLIKEVETKPSRSLPQSVSKGGLANYRWDTKSSLAPFMRTSKRDIVSSVVTLHRVNTLIKKGIGGVIHAVISQRIPGQQYTIPSAKEIQELSDAVDVACSLYLKKVYCLGWAATFAIEAIKKGWHCNFAVGVQSIPFYAHAWAEIDSKVINDEPQIQEYLTVLLREPFGS